MTEELSSPAADERLQEAPESASEKISMPFLDHLEELRWRILKALAAVCLGALVCYIFSNVLLQGLTYPYKEAVHSLHSGHASGAVHAVQQLVEGWLGAAPEAPESAPADDAIPPGRQLQLLGVMTSFFVNLQVALLGGLVLALPVVFYQIWAFIAPGLLSTEKRLVLPIVAMSVFCFALGALIAYWVVLPLGLRFFLGLEPPDTTSQWALDSYISFVLRLLLGFGVVFELPVLALFLTRIGLLTPQLMRRTRRYAIVVTFVLAAIFTPPDPLSQLLMALPILLLYEVSIWISKVSRPRS